MSDTTHQQTYDQISALIAEGIPESKCPEVAKKQWMNAAYID